MKKSGEVRPFGRWKGNKKSLKRPTQRAVAAYKERIGWNLREFGLK
jgi:hypothetical protein